MRDRVKMEATTALTRKSWVQLRSDLFDFGEEAVERVGEGVRGKGEAAVG